MKIAMLALAVVVTVLVSVGSNPVNPIDVKDEINNVLNELAKGDDDVTVSDFIQDAQDQFKAVFDKANINAQFITIILKELKNTVEKFAEKNSNSDGTISPEAAVNHLREEIRKHEERVKAALEDVPHKKCDIKETINNILNELAKGKGNVAVSDFNKQAQDKVSAALEKSKVNEQLRAIILQKVKDTIETYAENNSNSDGTISVEGVVNYLREQVRKGEEDAKAHFEALKSKFAKQAPRARRSADDDDESSEDEASSAVDSVDEDSASDDDDEQNNRERRAAHAQKDFKFEKKGHNNSTGHGEHKPKKDNKDKFATLLATATGSDDDHKVKGGHGKHSKQ